MAFVLLQDGSLFFYRILESKIWAPPDRLICPLRTRLRSGRNAADTYGCRGRSLSAGVTLRPLMDISIDPSPRNQQFSKIRQRKRAPGKPVQTGRRFSSARKADTLSGQESAPLKGKKAPISPGFDSSSVLDRSDAAMCRLRTVKERRHLDRVFCDLMCPLRSVPSESVSAIDIWLRRTRDRKENQYV